MRLKKILELIQEIYRDLYKNSTPSADFDELVANAELNERGEKIIHFMDYYLEKGKFDEIVESHLKGRKLTERELRVIKFQIYLGASPTSTKVQDR